MPWETFGLDADASERDLKRAYARLLKQHRPDRDPEGFARINAAYASAKREISWRESENESDRSEDKGPPDLGASNSEVGLPVGFLDKITRDETGDRFAGSPIPARRDLPEIFVEREQILRDAYESGAEEIGEELHQFNMVCADHPGCISDWGESLLEIFHDDALALSYYIDVDDLLRELEMESDLVTMYAIDGWQVGYHWVDIEELTHEILTARERYANEAVGRVCVRLAHLLAIVRPSIAENLANHAFATLPSALREWVAQGLDRSLANGLLFHRFPQDQKLFWARRLNEPPGEWDWSTMESVDALNFLNGHHGRGIWPGYDLVAEVIPEDLRVRFEQSEQQERERRKEAVETSHLSNESSDGWGCATWVAIIFVVNLLFFVFNSCDP